MDILHECRVCHIEQPETNFFRATKKDYVDRICKSCKHNAMQKRRHDFKQWCVDYKGGKCIVCGYNNCNRALDFHHLDPKEKDFSFGGDRHHNIISKEKAKIELDKCVLLCRNCHAEVHAGFIDLQEYTRCS